MLINPYETINESNMKWQRVNLHVHVGICKKGECGEIPLQDAADAYAHAGYDAIAITTHDFQDPISLELEENSITLLKGIEYSSNPHIVFIGIETYEGDTHQEALDYAVKSGAFAILAHPNWQNKEYLSHEMMEQLSGYAGIEIYNGGIFKDLGDSHSGGSGLALDKWDYLLSKGIKTFGFGNDDIHHWDQFDRVYNKVYAKSANFEDIKEAVERGCFYVSTGVELEYFSIKNNTINIKAKSQSKSYVDTFSYKFTGAHGKLLHETIGSEVSYTVDSSEPYVRIEVTSENGAKMYLQPIWQQ